MDNKPTNPKDMIGTSKLSMHLVPSVIPAYAAIALTEGALKYGKYNWRVAGVRTSIYIDAMRRHLEKYQNGEWADPVTRVPHLASVIACAGIILDAYHCDKLTDDRPPPMDMGSLIDGMQATVIHLQELFKDHIPHQWTIEDFKDANPRVNSGVLQEVPCQPEGEEGSSCEEPCPSVSREGGEGSQG